MALDPVADFEHRLAHPDVQRLSFFASRDRAAIVVRQDDDGHVVQARIEQPLGAHIEIGNVDDRPRHTTSADSRGRWSARHPIFPRPRPGWPHSSADCSSPRGT